MASAPSPRLTSGIAASVLVHAALLVGLLALRPARPPMQPPMYRVQLIAAPAAPPAAGVVRDVPPVQAAEQPPEPAPLPTPLPAAVKPTVAPAKARPAPVKPTARAVTPSSPTVTPEPKKDVRKETTPPPSAGGGATGGKGADVANIDTPGIEFPYPAYTTNIVSQLIRRFGAMQGTLTASVRFVIRRDGSVDLESIKIVTPSGNYPFDLRAVGAVESAAKSNAFGPLPKGFREDILPVTFRFSPSGFQ